MGVSLYKQMYGSKDDRKETEHWYVQVRARGHARVRVPGFTSKSESERLGRQIEKLITAKLSGGGLSPELALWIKGLPVAIVEKLAGHGLIGQAVAAAQGKSLQSHIDDYAAELRSRKDKDKHIRHVKSVLEKTCKARGWTALSEVDDARLKEYLARLGDISARTYNHTLGCWKSFCRWMCEMGRAESSPVEYIKGRPVKKDRRRIRRALDLEDIRKLLRVTRAAKKRHHMTGEERALIYQVAIETGLRLGELRKLKINAFDLKAHTVLVRSSISKNAKLIPLSLRSATVSLLAAHFAAKFPANKAFPRLPEKAANMLKKDLAEAKIPYKDDNDEFFDFHALRGETATLGVKAGADPKDLQAHMRHSDIHLTMDVYAKVRDNASQRIAGTLPGLEDAPQSEARPEAS